MRKRIIKKTEKVCRCAQKEWTRIICALVVIAGVFSCNPGMQSKMYNDPLMQKSWDKFCESYVLDKNNPTEDEIVDFLDAWRGSVEEEMAVPEMYE